MSSAPSQILAHIWPSYTAALRWGQRRKPRAHCAGCQSPRRGRWRPFPMRCSSGVERSSACRIRLRGASGMWRPTATRLPWSRPFSTTARKGADHRSRALARIVAVRRLGFLQGVRRRLARAGGAAMTATLEAGACSPTPAGFGRIQGDPHSAGEADGADSTDDRGSVLDPRAYPDRPGARSPLAAWNEIAHLDRRITKAPFVTMRIGA